MARFYQTTDPQFVDDFIYQPNWQLATQVLQNKDNDIRNQIEMISILGNPEMEFVKDADASNVNQIKDEYETRADDIARELQNNLNNPLRARQMLTGLRRDLERDYQTGRIRNIQDNFKAYTGFQERLSKMANPADREAYGQAWNRYLQNNQRGALDSIFKAPEMYDSRNLTQEFLSSDSFKQLKASMNASSIDQVQGRWIAKVGNEEVELSPQQIANAYKGFVEGDASMRGYINSRREFFGENDWLDDQGNFNWASGGRLDRDIQTLGNYAYKNTKKSKGIEANPYETASHASALRMREQAQMAELNARLTAKYGSKDGKGGGKDSGQTFYNKEAEFFRSTAQGKQLTKDYNTNRTNLLTSVLSPQEKTMFASATPKRQQEILKELEFNRLPVIAKSNPAAAQLMNNIGVLDRNFDEAFQVGFGTYAKFNFTDKELKQVQDHYATESVGLKVDKSLGHWNFGQRPSGGYYTSKGTNKGVPENNRGIIGSIYDVPGPFKGAEIVDVVPHTKSALPWMPLTSGKGFRGATLDYDIKLKMKGDEDREITVPATWYATDYEDLVNSR